MRLDREKVSNTVITQSFNPREKLHPVQNRGISLREGARIQSFPDDFEFEGKFKEKARQIGNAVPPLLAYKIAEHLKKLDEEDSRSKVKTV
jgi:DNA (cytosine-5)-methyltransferase 1